jgi:hypothetical protein
MPDSPDDHRVTIRLSPELYTQLQARGSQGQPLAAIVRQALMEYLARQPGTPESAVELATAVAVMAARLDGLQDQVEALAARLETVAAERQPPATRHRQPRQPRPPGRPGLPPAQLQAIAEARALYPDLSLAQLAQHLYEAGIYQTTGKDGQARPVDHSRLRRWLLRAQEAGLL